MTEYLAVVLALIVSRIVTALIGLAFAYFGYRLFSLGVYAKAGELRAAWGEKHLMLKQAAPGTFFALFGGIITAAALLGGGDVERAQTVTSTAQAKSDQSDGQSSSIRHEQAVNLEGQQKPTQKKANSQDRQSTSTAQAKSDQSDGQSSSIRHEQAVNLEGQQKPTQEKANFQDRQSTQQNRITTHLNQPPVMDCTAQPSSVPEGSGQVIHLRANASSPGGAPLTYSWQANEGHIDGVGDEATWDPSGLKPGDYTINVQVDDGVGGRSACASNVRVERRPRP